MQSAGFRIPGALVGVFSAVEPSIYGLGFRV